MRQFSFEKPISPAPATSQMSSRILHRLLKMASTGIHRTGPWQVMPLNPEATLWSQPHYPTSAPLRRKLEPGESVIGTSHCPRLENQDLSSLSIRLSCL